MEKITDEIKDVVQDLLDNEEQFTAYYIEKELTKMGIKVSRTTIVNLRIKKTSLDKTSYETIAKLYHFAKTHENKNKEKNRDKK